MTSFVLSRFPVPQTVFDDIDARLSRLPPEPRRFLLHVLASNVLNFHKIDRHDLYGWLDLAIELPCQWVEEHFGRHFDPSTIPPELLSIVPYSTTAHRCRSFRAADLLLLPLLEWAPASTLAASQIPLVNLFTGEPHQPRKLKEWEDGIQCTKPIRDAVASFSECPFNGAALDAHLASLRDAVADAAPDKRLRAERRLRNDLACAAIMRAGCAIGDDGLFSYRPEYRASYTGRIVEVGGGAQSCSKAMKVALFDGVLDLRNYDLRAAQGYILLQELEDAGLPHVWIEHFLAEAGAAQTRGTAIGMSKGAYKQCLYATIMGAPHACHWDPDANAIFRAMLKEAERDERRAKELTIAVHGALAPLKVEVDAWHEDLMTSPSCARLDSSRKKVRTLLNACGLRFKLEGDAATILARKAAAFILQGQEAAFIHKLTTLGAEHGYVPISNQHDGLVVIGEVPDAAVVEAANATGLRYPHLDQKPFL